MPRDAVGAFTLEGTALAYRALQFAQKVEELRRLQAQLDDMLVQARMIANFDWGHGYRDLQQLSALVRRSRALAYSAQNLEEEYSRRYGVRSDYAGRDMGSAAMAVKYQQWSEETRDNALTTLRVAGMQAEEFDTEEQTLQQLQSASQSSEGRMQALQVGHEIGIQEVRQLQKLRQLMRPPRQMEADRMAAEQDEPATGQQKIEDANRDLATTPPPVDDGTRF